MLREKQTSPKTVHFKPSVAQALDEARKLDSRTLSAFVSKIVERDPVVQLFIQKIEGRVERS